MYGEAYLLEKIQLAEHHKKTGKIHTSLAGWLVRAIKNDFKNEALQLQETKKEKRQEIREARELEIQESERKMEEQRQARINARKAVGEFLDTCSQGILLELEAKFTSETLYQPSDIELFHDWVAEKEDL